MDKQDGGGFQPVGYPLRSPVWLWSWLGGRSGGESVQRVGVGGDGLLEEAVEEQSAVTGAA